MSDIVIVDKRYRNEKVINFVESIGYTRLDNYYVIVEKDGYINVSFCKIPYLIGFHKNFFYHVKKDINEIFYNFEDFQKFMESYHKKKCRKLKIKKIGYVGS